jgi:hypothetical protein
VNKGGKPALRNKKVTNDKKKQDLTGNGLKPWEIDMVRAAM